MLSRLIAEMPQQGGPDPHSLRYYADLVGVAVQT
jgi:hypothetical protein